MPTTRVMPGIVNMEGRTVNTLKVGQMVSRHPRPRYDTTCQRCNSRSTESQDRLVSGAARCLAAHCGTPSKRPERLDSSENVAAQRKAELEAAQLQASAARMDAETQDYQRPERYAPTPDPLPPMSAREVAANRERREQQEAERRAAEAPRLEAERLAAEEQEAAEVVQRERTEKQRAYWAEAIRESPDPKLFVSPELVNAAMPTAKANAFNAKEVAKFIETTPEFAEYKTPQNADAILMYLSDRNGVRIFDAATLKAAFIRLRDLGILEKRPAPQPQRVEPQRVNLDFNPKPTKPKDGLIDGWDPVSGEPRRWTPRELDRLSADDYRRALRLYKADLELPNVGPGPVRH